MVLLKLLRTAQGSRSAASSVTHFRAAARVALYCTSSAQEWRVPNTLPHSCSGLPDHVKTLLQKRRETLKPVGPFKLAGVTFEGRQEAVQQLRPAECVLLQKTPHPQDPNAVHVLNLYYTSLGWIPREHNQKVTADLCLGQVTTAGSAAAGVHGAKVQVVPDAPAMLPLPIQVEGVTNYLTLDQLGGQAMLDKVLEKQGGRCAFTRLTAQEAGPMSLTPRFQMLADGVVELVGIKAVAEPLAAALQQVHLAKDTPEGKAARDIICAANDWNIYDLEFFLLFLKTLKQVQDSKSMAITLRVSAPELARK